MSVIRLDTHVSELIFESLKQMVGAHQFTYNEDASGTETGTKKKEFKLNMAQAENTGRSNLQALRLTGLFEITLFHNAEGATEQGKKRALRDIEDLIFEIERFAPTGNYSDVRSKYIETTNLLNWQTEPIKTGSDHVIRTVIQYEIGYKVSNPSI